MYIYYLEKLRLPALTCSIRNGFNYFLCFWFRLQIYDNYYNNFVLRFYSKMNKK